MRILLDNCVHRKLKTLLRGHDVKHASEAGLHRLRNGELLRQAAQTYEVMLTTDKNIRHQQNLEKLPIDVVELNTTLTRLTDLQQLEPFMNAALALTAQFRFVSVAANGAIETAAPK